jgi:hypothetical protein
MSSSINTQFLINTSHYVGSNVYRFNLPSVLKLDGNSEIALTSCSLYNSTFNIKASWKNNKFVILTNSLNLSAIPAGYNKGNSYTDPITASTIAQKFVEIVIPDGYYDISSLDEYLQNQCQTIGFYLQSTNGLSNLYFIEFLTNPQRYSTQINLFFIPLSLPTGFIMPSNSCFTLSSGSAKTAYFYFPTASTNSVYGGLSDIFGFNSGTCLPTFNNNTTETENLSVKCPKVSPITTYIIACNLIYNPLTIPNNLMTQINLGGSLFGGIIKYTDYPNFISCRTTSTQYIQIELYDENLNPLEINDVQMSLILTWKQYINRK